MLTTRTALQICLICDGAESSCLAVICAALMLQGGRIKALDISDGASAAEESAWHQLTVRVGEEEPNAPRWLDHCRHMLWSRKATLRG